MGSDIFLIIYPRSRSHRIEVIILLEPFLYFFAETVAYLTFPCSLLADIIPSIQRKNIQEVDVIMEQQHGVTIVVKTEDIHPPKTGISVHFCVLSLMAMQN